MNRIDEWLCANLFEAVPMSICVIDTDFQIVKANRRFTGEYGPATHRPCYEVYKKRSSHCDNCAAVETFRDGRVRSREEEGAPRGNGTPGQYLVHMIPIFHSDGRIPYVIEMSTDITPIKRLEQEKREAERLAAVGETVAGIAHGIKNVLMGLEGGLYAVNTGIAQQDDARIARGWEMLQENVTRISQFVKEFLDFARGREAQVTLVDPNAPVRRAMRLFGDQAAEAGILLRADIQEPIAVAPLDEDGIATCLANLVSNAIDACLCAGKDRRYQVTVSSREEQNTIVYEVVDNGQGMDYEISRQVFSKFVTTKGSDRGTGLGLLTTKKIVHQHGGKISFTSREGEGSRFRIELPRISLPRITVPEEDGRSAVTAGGREEGRADG